MTVATRNHLDQPIGFPMPDWTARQRPAAAVMEGRHCRLEPLTAEQHAADLHEANSDDREGRNWTYLGIGPFESFDAYRSWVEEASRSSDPLFFAIVDSVSGRAVGVATFMRIDPANGVIEVGNINFSPRLQRRPAATEAMYLMMRRVFEELGYRRYEWKFDSLNLPSRRAAERYGFEYEGLFRQAVVYKGRNRDTAWFSILDSEWPALKQAFETWLDAANFAADGQQRQSLADLTRRARLSLAG